MTTTGRSDNRQRAYFGPWSCLLMLLVVLALCYIALRGLGAFLITGDRLEPVDAVVVLGGGGEHRVEEAVGLVQQKYSVWLIITEPGELVEGEGNGSNVFRRVAIDYGMMPDNILITRNTASSTYEEAKAVRQLMEQRGMTSIIIVTDPFHTRRTRLIFRDVFTGSGFSVRVHPVQGHWYRSGTWFLSLEGWGHTLREYVKLVGFLAGIYQTLE